MMLKELIIGLVIVAGLSAAMNPEDYDALYPTEYPDQPADYYQPPPDSAYFTNEEPADAGSLVDQGAVDDPSILSSVPEGNGLWIVDGLNYEHTVSLNVPPKSWANQEIVPSVGGDLVIYYEYPTGQIVTQHLGRVRPYHRYWAWFYGPFPGVYKVWYVIDGVYRSNYVWYYVREDWPWWYGGYTFTTYYYTLPVRYYYRPIVYEPIRWTYKYTWEWRSTGHTWHDGWHDGHHDGRPDGRREFVTTIIDP